MNRVRLILLSTRVWEKNTKQNKIYIKEVEQQQQQKIVIKLHI